jgi:hypothetical protein
MLVASHQSKKPGPFDLPSLISLPSHLQDLFKGFEVGVLMQEQGTKISAVQRVIPFASFIDARWSEHAGSPSRGASENTSRFTDQRGLQPLTRAGLVDGQSRALALSS